MFARGVAAVISQPEEIMKFSKTMHFRRRAWVSMAILSVLSHMNTAEGLMLPMTITSRGRALSSCHISALSPKWNIFAPVAMTASTFFSMALEQL